MKFTITEQIQLGEVKRRMIQFKNDDIQPHRMVFLGLPSEVKSLVKKGILTPYSKEIKRVLNWYDLTEKGLKHINFTAPLPPPPAALAPVLEEETAEVEETE